MTRASGDAKTQVMHLELFGAADGVTGSLHRLHVQGRDVLLDCGLFQGHRAEANRRNREVPDWAVSAHALVLSHAHIDHSGNIPSLVRRGFDGHVFCSPATRDLSSVMLRDSAIIQEQDAAYLNRRAKREGREEVVDPIYTIEDAQKAISQMISIPLYRRIEVAPGVELTLHNAGHVLGSAMVQLDLQEKGKHTRLLFTGDLGREALPLLKKPDHVKDVNVLLMESTYGDRSHPDVAHIDDELATAVSTTIARGGRVYIPSFALERAQEVLFTLERLHEAKKIPEVPIYIDSPLAIAITEVYKLHPECLETNVQKRIIEKNDPFSPPGLRYISDIEDSKRLQSSGEPCIIIAGSGMCEAGRIVHHFSRGLSEPKNSVVIVGFQAEHTLGRRLVERRRKVKVLGLERDVFASIYTVGGLSAHADREDLVRFARETYRLGALRKTVLVHGEDAPKLELKNLLVEAALGEVVLSSPGLQVEL